MGMNDTPSSERLHIGFFGQRNAGKSSLVNEVTGQPLSIVSEIKGTTTDPVRKAMELLPLGPVLIIDTPGYDDSGELGLQRIERANKVLDTADAAVLVIDATTGASETDSELIRLFEQKAVPYIVAYNKSDLLESTPETTNKEIYVSALESTNIEELKNLIAQSVDSDDTKHFLVGDIISPADIAVLVVPIDTAAPKGRLILPQQQVIRDILECDAMAVMTKEYELKETLKTLTKKPRLVITDSQVFAKVSADTPRDVPLTSFSILFARYKGLLNAAVDGINALDTVCSNDRILICEGCTHHRQCDDIGTVKLPRWIREYLDSEPKFEFTAGSGFPDDLSGYKLIVHCGGCMLTERAVRLRMKKAQRQNIPITNYGILIAHLQGILERCLEVFKN